MNEAAEKPRSAVQNEQDEPESWVSWKLKWGSKQAWLFSPEWAMRWAVYALQHLAIFRLLELGGKLAIAVTCFMYWWERDARRQLEHNQAWTLIMTARGAPGDGGRKSALQNLARDGVSLAGAPLENAVLENINLKGAFLEGANFSSSLLRKSSFAKANLLRASFQNATLDGVDFSGATLVGADFRGTKGTMSFDTSTILTAANFFEFQDIFMPGGGAHYCQTIMPNGDVNNKDCNEDDSDRIYSAQDYLARSGQGGTSRHPGSSPPTPARQEK